MKKILPIFLSIVSVLLLLLSGCDDSNVPDYPVQPVIEGWITSDGFPTVQFTTSVRPGIDGSISDNIILWGTVSISDGETTRVMTAGPSDRLNPPYRYYCHSMFGKPGVTYTIRARYKDMIAEATCRMPSPTPIDSIRTAKTEIDTLRSATLYFTAPEDTPAYYYLTMNLRSLPDQPLPCMLGSIKVTEPGKSVNVPVFNPKRRLDDTDYYPNHRVGDTIVVNLNRITPEVYEFWRAYDNMNNFTNSPFISSSESLPGNIRGGLGIFSAMGTTTKVLVIK